MARKFLRRKHVNKSGCIRDGKYSIIALVVLICLVFVACFFLSSSDDREVSEMETRYISVCKSHDFSMYQQEITDKSTAGIVKGYISKVDYVNVQMDFFEFENEDFANEAYKRIVGWVMVHYGNKSYAGVDITGNEWSLQYEGVYFKAVREGNLLTYILCTDKDHIEHAKVIFDYVAEA